MKTRSVISVILLKQQPKKAPKIHSRNSRNPNENGEELLVEENPSKGT
jgi:hypothetical protein